MLIDTLNVTYTSTAGATVSVYLKVFSRLFKHVAVVLWLYISVQFVSLSHCHHRCDYHRLILPF